MKFKKVFRRLTWGITPTKWLSLGYLKQQTASLKDLSQGVFQPTSTPKYQCKTFEEAMQRRYFRTAIRASKATECHRLSYLFLRFRLLSGCTPFF